MRLDCQITEMIDADWPEVREIYQEGMATGQATFQTEAPFCTAFGATLSFSNAAAAWSA